MKTKKRTYKDKEEAKDVKYLKALKARESELLKQIEAELDYDKNRLLVRDLNNLQGRISVADNRVNPDKRKKQEVVSVTRIKSVPTKRCG